MKDIDESTRPLRALTRKQYQLWTMWLNWPEYNSKASGIYFFNELPKRVKIVALRYLEQKKFNEFELRRRNEVHEECALFATNGDGHWTLLDRWNNTGACASMVEIRQSLQKELTQKIVRPPTGFWLTIIILWVLTLACLLTGFWLFTAGFVIGALIYIWMRMQKRAITIQLFKYLTQQENPL